MTRGMVRIGAGRPGGRLQETKWSKLEQSKLDGEKGVSLKNIQEVRLQDLQLNGYEERRGRSLGRLPVAAINPELMHLLPWSFSF